MTVKRNDVVLFFTKERVVTEEELALSDKIGGKVLFRSSKDIKPDDNTENCNYVIGEVPPQYKAKFTELVIKEPMVDVKKVKEVESKPTNSGVKELSKTVKPSEFEKRQPSLGNPKVEPNPVWSPQN